jgi:hypothetical protein
MREARRRRAASDDPDSRFMPSAMRSPQPIDRQWTGTTVDHPEPPGMHRRALPPRLCSVQNVWTSATLPKSL